MDAIDLLIEGVEAVQGVRLERSDVEPMMGEIAYQKQVGQRAAWNVANCEDAWVAQYEVEGGKIGSVLVSGALGFLAGGWVGAAIGILGALFRGGPKKPNKRGEERRDVKYGFDSGGSLAPSGTPLPLIYCNRTIDPGAGGGVRVGGFLLTLPLLKHRFARGVSKDRSFSGPVFYPI